MSIHKDKDRKTWYVKHQNQTTRGFTSKKSAEEYESRLKVKAEIIKRNNHHLFSVVARDFLENKKSEVQYSTYYKSKEIVEKNILPNVEDKPVEDFCKLDCRRFKDELAKSEYSTRHKNNILNHFKAIFKHAQKYYELTTDPTQFLAPFKKSFEEKVKGKRKENEVWDYEEFRQFIASVDQQEYRVLFIVLFLTGLRLGEALALSWEDFADQKLTITKSATKLSEKDTFEIKDTKNTSSIRDVSLNPSLCALLLEYKQKEMLKVGFEESWFIFGETKPLSRTSITRRKDEAIEKSGVKRITIHQFRHSHATNLINDGVNVVAVSRRLGHADVSMTLRIYTHLFQKIDVELIDNLEKSSQNLLTRTI